MVYGTEKALAATASESGVACKYSVVRILLEFRSLVVKKAEAQWGSGIVEQLSLDLKDAFPNTKGFSTTNIWYAKKWYMFYNEHLT